MVGQVPNRVSTFRGINQLFLREIGRRKPDLNLLRDLLAKGADPNQSSAWNKSTPLTKAIRNHNSAVVKLLIEFKVDVKAANHPLRQAIKKDDLEIVKLITDAGASSTLDDLMYAFINPNPGIIQHLLNQKLAELDDKGVSEYNTFWVKSALYRAEESGNPLLEQMVSDAIERQKAEKAAAAKDDPRDTRIAELEEQMRDLTSRLNSTQDGIEELKNPKPVILEKKKHTPPFPKF